MTPFQHAHMGCEPHMVADDDIRGGVDAQSCRGVEHRMAVAVADLDVVGKHAVVADGDGTALGRGDMSSLHREIIADDYLAPVMLAPEGCVGHYRMVATDYDAAVVAIDGEGAVVDPCLRADYYFIVPAMYGEPGAFEECAPETNPVIPTESQGIIVMCQIIYSGSNVHKPRVLVQYSP